MGFTYIWSMDGGAWDWVRLITAEQCVYHIGANCGQSTLHLARAVGRGGRVIAFEPVPLNFRQFVQQRQRSRGSALGRGEYLHVLSTDGVYRTS
jgi:precorrin-6B methylase 2